MIRDYSKNSLFVGYLKELLHEFNMPMIQVYVDKDTTPAIKDRLYIKDNNIVKFNGKEFEKVTSYNEGKSILNFTKNFNITSSEYDIPTHNYLGDYLRYLRDYSDINLMGLYNCFYNEQPIEINKNIKGVFSINTDDQKYNYYVIKAKFGREYTISIDCPFQYEIASILYDTNLIEEEDEDLIKKTYQKIPGSIFKKPFLYSKLKGDFTKYWKKEQCLKIIIKLPREVDSSIVVLEGDFSKACNVVSGVFVDRPVIDDNMIIDSLPCKLSLLSQNNKVSYPFADTLVQYLIGQSITKNDRITENIELVQDFLYNYENTIRGTYGVYSKETKSDLYKEILKLDVTNGFVTDESGDKKTRIVESNIIDKNIDNWSENFGALVRSISKCAGCDGNVENCPFKYNECKLSESERNLVSESSSANRYKLRFIDNHEDITGFVDKDVEQMLSLGVV